MKIDNDLLDKLVNIVVENKVEVGIDVSPDNIEIKIEPWKPYEVKCPYEKG